MSYRKVSAIVAAAVTALLAALVIAGGAYGDPGKSQNGVPGPAGNPNQPSGQPQANAPQGSAGNDSKGQSQDSHGKSESSKGKSDGSHGKSNSSHGKGNQSHPSNGSHGKSGSAPSRSNGSHANLTPGKPATSHSNNGHAGKITICHATRSATNPYVEITISVNGLHGHGPADDSRHHAGSWKDIIPAPEGGCPGTVPSQQTAGNENKGATPNANSNANAGKITICHATRSVTNPYVEITISVNGLHGHGPADDSRHHAGSWKDIIPAPAEGCPGTTAPLQQSAGTEQPSTTTVQNTIAPTLQNIAAFIAPLAPVTPTAPATTPAPESGNQAVLGERESGTSPGAAVAPAASNPGASKVLGERAAGNSAPASTLAARAAGNSGGSLPFTGFQLAIVLIAAAAALLGGFALRRATSSSRS